MIYRWEHPWCSPGLGSTLLNSHGVNIMIDMVTNACLGSLKNHEVNHHMSSTYLVYISQKNFWEIMG